MIVPPEETKARSNLTRAKKLLEEAMNLLTEAEDFYNHKPFVAPRKALPLQQSQTSEMQLFAKEHGLQFKVFSHVPPMHLRIAGFDYWPATERFKEYKGRTYGRGYSQFMEIINTKIKSK